MPAENTIPEFVFPATHSNEIKKSSLTSPMLLTGLVSYSQEYVFCQNIFMRQSIFYPVT